MNDELILILSSIKAALGNGRGTKTTTDSLCDALYNEDSIKCDYINCIDCIIGYNDSTQYAYQVIQTWKVL